MEDKVKITVKCKQVVEYSQDIYVSQAEAEVLRSLENDVASERENYESFLILDTYLDKRDVMDADQEFTDIEMES